MMNLGENPILNEQVEPESELKSWLVNYVGDKKSPEDGNVTVEMIIDVVSKEFPEFVMAFAEENWIRGYHQAFVDIEEGQKIYEQQQSQAQLNSEQSE